MSSGEILAKRRRHKNSKFGCPNCKKRRVKCSEDLPQCMNCIKHKVKCGYLDYPPEKLEELKRAKSTQFAGPNTGAFDKSNELDATGSFAQGRSGSAASATSGPGLHSSSISLPPSVSSNVNINDVSPTQPPTTALLHDTSRPGGENDNNNSGGMIMNNSNLNLNDQISNLTIGLKTQFPPSFQTTQNLNNILNFSQNSITQNFDNLVTETPDLSIIYPVYSITNNQPNHYRPGNNITPDSHVSNVENYINLEEFDYQNDDNNFHQQSLLQGLSNPAVPNPLPQDFLLNCVSPTPVKTEKFLPNAHKSEFKFKKLAKVEHNYRDLLIDVVTKLGPLINTGQANLFQIKELYSLWLNSFLFKSYDSDLMFSCLINLTTNFLISNTFNNFNMTDTKANSFITMTNIKNILIMISIKYYAKVIKGLRNFLNHNFDPELCSSVSYILSLMSIYDPEVTLNSITCFTNGLFSVLKYNIALSIKKGIVPPLLIPVHLKLMHNIEKSIYFPGYDPEFLNEYQTKLQAFGRILNQIPANNSLNELLKKQFATLLDFTDSTIKEYIPILNSNLSDNHVQQEILFKMTSKWVRFYPSRLLVVNKNSNLLEKIVYLFYKLMKKGLFAILPQVKFYFLRDFDSPLMLDVFTFINDNEIFNSADFDAKPMAPFKQELKQLTAYLIRCLNYFQRRLQFLYKTIVYQSSTKNLFPIEDRKDFVINIPLLRKIFYQSLDIKEVNLKSFSNSYIKPYHFPHMQEMKQLEDEEADIDFLTLNEQGFLDGDRLE